MKVSDFLKADLFIMALKQLEIKNRELELQNVKAWLKAYDNGEYLVEGVK